MSQSRLQRTIAHYRQVLARHEADATQVLEAAYSGILASLQPALTSLYGQKRKAGEDVPVSWLYEQRRLETLKALIEDRINQYASITHTTVAHLQHTAAQIGMQAAHDLLSASVPAGVSWTFGLPSFEAINRLIGATQAGSPLADLFRGFGKEAADKVAQALISGLALGNNPREVARDVQEALGISRARALTIARTEQLRAYRTASQETMSQNQDVVQGWTWVASLDRSTCAACIAMNGTQHDVSESMDSHPNCRCVMAPLTKSWDDILSPLGIDGSDIPDTSIDIESGSDWFDRQDAATQREVLGSDAAYQLYADGDASLEDFVGWNHDEQWGRSLRVKSTRELLKRK